MPLTPADITQITSLIATQLAANRIKISALPAAGAIGPSAVFPIVDSGSTQKLSLAALLGKGFATVGVGQDLRAINTTPLVDGSMFYITGVDTPDDGGEGFFIYDEDSIATDNTGTVIAPDDGHGRFIRQFPDGVVNVKWFEVKGDGETVDTANIQKVFDFVAGTQYAIWFPNGTYLINAGLVFLNGYMNRITGTGPAVIKWDGAADASAKMITFEDCYACTFQGIRLVGGANAVGVGVWFKNGAGVSTVSTSCRLIEVEIDGVAGKIGTCVRVGGTGSTDANNDFHVLQNCILTNFSADGLSLENSQVYNIALRNTKILGNGYGVHLINASNGPSGFGGSFSWIGGGGGGITGACFFLGVPTNGPTLVQDVNFETSDRLLESAFGASGFIYNVLFKDCRWAANSVNADGRMILWKYAGSITIDGGTYGDGTAAATALTIFNEANYPTKTSMCIIGALFFTNAPSLCTSIKATMLGVVRYDQGTDTFALFDNEMPFATSETLMSGTYAGLQRIKMENLHASGETGFELAVPNAVGARVFQLRHNGPLVLFFDATGNEPLFRVDLDGGKAVYTYGSLRTGDPTGGTAKLFRVGEKSAVTPTSPNRTVKVEVDGEIIYLAGKTTND